MGDDPPPYTESVPPEVPLPEDAGEQRVGRTQQIKRTWSRLSTPSWLYPFYGIVYFTRNRFLWPLLKGRLLPCFLLSLFIYTILFMSIYLPQVAFLAIWHGLNASAFINGASLVLGEGSLLIALLFEALLVDHTQVDIFDAVLVAEGHSDLVSRGREIYEDPTLDPRQRLGAYRKEVERVYSPFSLRQVIEFVIFLPLNFIPYAGVPLFLFATGLRAGPFQHWRYFKLLGITKKERKSIERRMSATYTWFGTVHLALQLVPGFSMLFLLTTAAGSALWVANLERERVAVQGDSGTNQGPAEDYIDNPV